MRSLPIISFVAILLLGTSQADARWFQRTAGPSRLQQIAQTLAAKPDGEIKEDIGITREPEASAPAKKAARRIHNPILTAECAKCAIFAGPGVLTALIEVGIEAANMRAADLMPTAEEALYDAHAAEGTTEGAAPATAPATQPAAPVVPEGIPEPTVPFVP